MFKRTRICAAAIAALSGGHVLPAMAQDAPQRVEITGSAIKRTSSEGPAPVEVLTRKDIERTGATTINELIRSLPSMDIFDQGELASNSPSGSGTANVGMRGLSSSETLVLLNGRRLPVNALYDSSGAGAAVDINMIPVSAIERVEVLKDGGSAIYGADAVAGVVNIITKNNYTGAEGTIGYGQTSRSDGKEKRATVVGGICNLEKDRFNVLLGFDVFKRDPIYRKDREISKSVDFRRYGSLDGRSSFAPEGNVIDPNTGGFINVPYSPCPTGTENPTGRCRYDFNSSILTSINGADRVSGMAIANFQVTPDIRVFGEVIAARTKDHFEAHPVPDYFVVPITDPAQRPAEIPCGRNGGADFGLGCDKVYIAGRFMQGGPRITDRKSTLLNIATGAEGTSFGLDWKVSLGHGVSKVTNQDSNYYDANKWVAATLDGSLNPTVNTNDPAFVEGLKVRPVRDAKSTIDYLNLQVSGPAFSLPGGMAMYAVGAALMRDKLTDTPDPLTQAGDVVGSIQQAAVSASRNSKAVFGELSLPIVKDLESQVAFRYDKYPDYSQTSPKVGLKYTPIKELALRGSYTKSFRAPVLKQLFGAREQGAITLTDADQCVALGVPLDSNGDCLVNAFQVNGSNPNLKPEIGKTLTLGAIVDVGPFTATIDWWRIKKTDEIGTPTVDDAIRRGLWSRDGARFQILTNLQNLAERENEGVDLDARLRFTNTPLGDVTVQNSTSYYAKQRRRDTSADPLIEYNGTYALPRWRNTLRVAADMADWGGTVGLRTVGGFYDNDDPESITSDTKKVPSETEVDLQVQYRGLKGFTFTGGIKNVFDRMPPFSAQNGTDNTYTQQGFAEVYNNRGRFWYLALTYAFQ